MGKNLPVTSSEAFARAAHYFYFMWVTWKYIAAWTSLMVYKASNENKSHTFGSLFIADNILKVAIITVIS